MSLAADQSSDESATLHDVVDSGQRTTATVVIEPEPWLPLSRAQCLLFAIALHRAANRGRDQVLSPDASAAGGVVGLDA